MKQLSLVALLILFSAPAMAYVGPGLGMGVIGTIFGVLAAIVLALFGLFWYPLKRAFNKKKTGSNPATSQAAATIAEQTAHPDMPQTQAENPSQAHPDKQDTNNTVALNETTEAGTTNRTETQV
ncbi:hypothetical protein [Granulosicoccus antarcticus]|uniref:Uncharacterized protein n=1 Tax=Granulosicoccus antarcticus IMCC3135 TaxID=1192854 RepID=A0A2Z2NUD6_9GAMM|nr:hypothetical protein [Granulosicoccus antarcticus]ASJ70714.1 hypothetical protein IMCC3135_03005 [Granulosicoccus antarcticus IMCC3135]